MGSVDLDTLISRIREHAAETEMPDMAKYLRETAEKLEKERLDTQLAK